MRFDLVTLFPQVIAQFAELGVTGEAVRQARLELAAWNPRDYCADQRPDDRPFGGGAGMVMQPEPLARAVRAAQAATAARRPVILLSPQGEVFNQSWAQTLATGAGAILVCGRYEGVDQRFIDDCVDVELSLGDFVLSGGELPALVLLDAVTRLLPGVLGDADSAVEESFVDGLLEYPQYTRPFDWRGRDVPAVLLSGHHAKIQQWRAMHALGRTWERRPDLLEGLALDAQDEVQLRAYITEYLAGLKNNATSD